MDLGLELAKFDIIKAQSLKDYEEKYTPKTVCANFKGIHQKPHAQVRDFRARVLAIIRKIYDSQIPSSGQWPYRGQRGALCEQASLSPPTFDFTFTLSNYRWFGPHEIFNLS